MGFIADSPKQWVVNTVDQQVELLNERLADDYDMRKQLINYRGGCTCFISPPCSACCEPLTVDEADILGWLE